MSWDALWTSYNFDFYFATKSLLSMTRCVFKMYFFLFFEGDDWCWMSDPRVGKEIEFNFPSRWKVSHYARYSIVVAMIFAAPLLLLLLYSLLLCDVCSAFCYLYVCASTMVVAGKAKQYSRVEQQGKARGALLGVLSWQENEHLHTSSCHVVMRPP